MPYTAKQIRYFHTDTAKKHGVTQAMVDEADAMGAKDEHDPKGVSDFGQLPMHAQHSLGGKMAKHLHAKLVKGMD